MPDAKMDWMYWFGSSFMERVIAFPFMPRTLIPSSFGDT